MSVKTIKSVRVARFVAFGIAAVSFAAATVHAADTNPATVAMTTVNYSDLDLSKDADVHALYVRLQNASERVCGSNRDLRDLRMKRLQSTCYQETLARAVDNVGHAAVKAVYAADERIKVAGRVSKAQAAT